MSEIVQPAAAPAPEAKPEAQPAAAALAPAPAAVVPAPEVKPVEAPAPAAGEAPKPPAAEPPKPEAPKADPPQADAARQAVQDWKKAQAEAAQAPAAEKEARQKAADDLKAKAQEALDNWKKVDAEAAAKEQAGLEPAAAQAPSFAEWRKAGFDLPDEHFQEIQKYATDKKLAPEQVKVLLQHQTELKKQIDAQWPETKKAWRHEFETDPEFGGDRFLESAEGAKRVLAKYGNQKFLNILDKGGFGDHPDFNRFLAALYYSGHAQDKYVRPGSGAPEKQTKTREEADAELFPVMTEQLKGTLPRLPVE